MEQKRRGRRPRTYVGWFKTLPKTIAILAIREYKRQKNSDENRVPTSLSSALNLGFIWASSKQGDLYWRKKYDRLVEVGK